jgi:hypothetical protein
MTLIVYKNSILVNLIRRFSYCPKRVVPLYSNANAARALKKPQQNPSFLARMVSALLPNVEFTDSNRPVLASLGLSNRMIPLIIHLIAFP